MKEIYDWVPWFTELSRKIAEGGPEFLVDRARRVSWGETTPALLRSEVGPDPLSFVYTIAAYSRTFARRRIIYPSISESFGLRTMDDADSEYVCIFPTPTPRSNLIFHNSNQSHLDALWTLFRQAVAGIDSIGESDFARVLQIRNMGVAKLTQTLFLVNPHEFIPLDNPTRSLIAFDLSKESRWPEFREAVANFREAFPGCMPCEINLFAWCQHDGQFGAGDQKCFQVDSDLDSDGRDHWQADFKPNNWVYTQGPGDDASWDDDQSSGVDTRFPLGEPKRGDIVLVRFNQTRSEGKGQARAIGVVYKNDYLERLDSASRLHVVWINKESSKLQWRTSTRRFCCGRKWTFDALRSAPAYVPTIRLLERIWGIEGLTWNHVLQAMDEYDDLGRDVFLKKYRYTKSRSYRINRNGNEYDMKPVWRRAYGYADAERAPSSDDVSAQSRVVKALLDELKRNKPPESEGAVTKSETNLPAEHKGPRNRILYGPPGTGKTWSTVRHALAIIDGVEVQDAENDRERFRKLRFDLATCNGQIAMVTFHQNFAYEDFVEGIRPVLADDIPEGSAGLRYERRDGIFKQIARAAESNAERRFVLIIDEINRGNIAKIFGELITLIEDSRRIGGEDETSVTLPYSGDAFGVADNLYVIGTMNTADRSIQLLDTALRRRFEFVEMMPDADHELIPEDVDGVKCRKMLRAMNECIAALLDREHQIGHTYLFDVNDMEQLSRAFQNKVFPLLQEYFFDDWTKIRAVLGGNGFVQEQNPPKSLQYSDLLDPESRNYDRLPNVDSRWRDPNEYRKIYESAKSDTAE